MEHKEQQADDVAPDLGADICPRHQTKVIKVDPNSFTDDELAEAVKLLQAGEVVAFPTETVYGKTLLRYCNSHYLSP